MNQASQVSVPLIGTIQPNPPVLAIRTAIDRHFEPGHAVIALILLVASFFAYTKLLANTKR